MTGHEANAVSRAEFDGMLATFGPFPADMAEQPFTERLVRYAMARGWLAYHARTAYDPRAKGWRTATTGDKGWPDCVFVRGDDVVVAELKAQGKYPKPDQRRWLEGMQRAAARSNGAIRVFVWRPIDAAEISEVLG